VYELLLVGRHAHGRAADINSPGAMPERLVRDCLSIPQRAERTHMQVNAYRARSLGSKLRRVVKTREEVRPNESGPALEVCLFKRYHRTGGIRRTNQQIQVRHRPLIKTVVERQVQGCTLEQEHFDVKITERDRKPRKGPQDPTVGLMNPGRLPPERLQLRRLERPLVALDGVQQQST